MSKKAILAEHTNADGLQVAASDEKLGFHGATPTVLREGDSGNQDAVAGTAATNSSPYGFAEAQANQLVSLVNEMRAVLVEKGLMTGTDAS